jgi:hypothetical protein
VTTAGDAQTWRRHHRPLADDQIGSVKPVTDEAQGGYTQRSHKLLEIIAVLILGITTVGTAWCGYQASQWNGAQSDLARESSDELVEASRLFGLATQKVSYDSTIIANYAIAVQEGDDQLTEFYRGQRSRHHLRARGDPSRRLCTTANVLRDGNTRLGPAAAIGR